MVKIVRECPILIAIVVMTIALSIWSLAFMNSAYAGYKDRYESGDMPLMALALKGANDGVIPYISEDAGTALLPEDSSEYVQETEPEAMEEVVSETVETTEEVAESEPEQVTEEEQIPENITYEFTEVDDEYFVDALFIGDSRTVGLSEYCEALDTRATFYSKISLTIYDVFKKDFIKTDEGKINLETALSDVQYGKIYIMLGLNEIGTGDDEYFKNAYAEVVDKLKELQPDAIIYIQGIMHVTENKSNNDKYFNNERINSRNAAISELADNRTVFYLNMNEAVDDENGNLEAALSFDDVHLKASSYERWHEFLLHNAIVR
jgi:hypothetical protein